MSELPLIAVIVPAKNRPAFLARLVDSVKRQRGVRTELVVVDDGSDPPLGGLGEGVTVVRNAESRGACASRNRGLEVSRADVVTFFDDDAELGSDDVLARSYAWLVKRPRAAAVGFRQTDAHGATRGVNPGSGGEPRLAPLFYTYGCMVRRKVFEELGGFAEPFFYYYEEMELSLRILDAGYDIVYDPDLAVIHHESEVGRDWKRISRLTLRNALLTVLLRYPGHLLAPGIARAVYNSHRAFGWRIGLDLGGKSGAAWEVLRLWRYALSERRPIAARTLLRYRSLGRTPPAA
ncbi:MAG TPA: glycosyltransferase [Polyangiaceae bacterium]|nr:glycosyltransferase [Polyangiaceae bacterium]